MPHYTPQFFAGSTAPASALRLAPQTKAAQPPSAPPIKQTKQVVIADEDAPVSVRSCQHSWDHSLTAWPPLFTFLKTSLLRHSGPDPCLPQPRPQLKLIPRVQYHTLPRVRRLHTPTTSPSTFRRPPPPGGHHRRGSPRVRLPCPRYWRAGLT